MKRNIVYAFMLTLALMLSGCGGNSIEDGKAGTIPPTITPNPDVNVSGKITTTLQGITIDKNSGDISANVTVSSTYKSAVVATLSSMDITLGGCPLVTGSVSATPSTVTLDTVTPTKNVTLTGKMQDADCVPTSYQLKGTNTILENGKTTSKPFTAKTGAIASSDITFEEVLPFALNAIDTKLDINESVEKAIRIRLTQGANGVSGQTIKAGNVLHGTLFVPEVQTDEFGQAIFIYTPPSPIVDNNFTIEFCLESNSSLCDTIVINLITGVVIPPDENETIGDDEINYGITFISSDGKNTLKINKKKTYTVALINADTKTIIPDFQLQSITVESKNPALVKFTVPNSLPVEKREILHRGESDLQLRSFSKAGLADILITVKFINTNSYSRELISTFAVTVLSGPPSTFDIRSAGVSYDNVAKRFENKFIISAHDKDSNVVNVSSTISVSAMAGYAKDSTGNWALYGKQRRDNDTITATLTPVAGKAQLEVLGANAFENYNPARDYIAVFGLVDKSSTPYEASGKWGIESIAGNIASLDTEYAGADYSGLGFAVGHNYRNVPCNGGYPERGVTVDSTDGSYELDESGDAYVTLKFPPFMVGKRVAIIVNFLGQTPETLEVLRSGEVHFKTLSSFDGLKDHSYGVAQFAPTRRVQFLMSIDTGGEDSFPYENSRFRCRVNITGSVSYQKIDTFYGNDPDPAKVCWKDVDGFIQGQAWVTYDITGGAEAGEFSLTNCRVLEEFIY